jgi:Amt family ammonium transporter
MLGPRIGKFNKDGSPNPIIGHHIPMAMLGTFILAFGWFGFNAGSSLAGTDLRISVAAVNTMLASAGGAMSSMIYMWIVYKKPDPTMIANGMLAGLVAITAPCGFVTAPVSVLIGAISGILVIWSVFFVERTLKLDDPVGAISVHGVNGAFGALALGLFADGTYGDGWNGVAGTVKGLFYGDASQFFAQAIGVTANLVWVSIATIVFWKITGLVVGGHRVSAEVEIAGLDLDEVGALAYPEFRMQAESGPTTNPDALPSKQRV